jgi:hypothetical protein
MGVRRTPINAIMRWWVSANRQGKAGGDLTQIDEAYGPRQGVPTRCGTRKGVSLCELGVSLDRAQLLADWTIGVFVRPDTSKLFENMKATKGSREDRHGVAEQG